MSIIAKNRIISEEERERRSKCLSKTMKGRAPHNKGKRMSKEFRERISECMKGTKHHTQPHSEETKRKISEHSKGKIVSQATREKLRQRAIEQWQRKREQKQQESEVI